MERKEDGVDCGFERGRRNGILAENETGTRGVITPHNTQRIVEDIHLQPYVQYPLPGYYYILMISLQHISRLNMSIEVSIVCVVIFNVK